MDEDDYKESDDNASYKNWLKEKFEIDSIVEPNKMIETA